MEGLGRLNTFLNLENPVNPENPDSDNKERNF